VAKKVGVRIREGYFEPLNIFTVTTLPPGNRKTAVFAAVLKPLEDHERSEAQRESGEIAKTRAAYKIKETVLKRRQEAAASAKGKDQERLTQEAITLAGELAEAHLAVPTRLIADDCTPEKLATLLRDQGGRIAVMSPEGDVFDLLAGRYSANGAGNFGVYLKGHAGDTLRIDRVGRPADFVKAPALTVGLAVQPEVIRGLAEKPGFRGRGLLGRFLYSLPVSLLGRRNTNAAPVPDDVRSVYQTNVIGLLSLPLRKDESGDAVPYGLNLDLDAQTILGRFEAWIEPQLSEFGELGGITDWAGKLIGAVGRIAGILHMANLAGVFAPWEIPIPPETIERAIRIGRYLIPHAKAAFAEMGADAIVEQGKSILRWIQHGNLDSFTRRDLHQALRGKFKRAAELDRPVALLIAQGFIGPQSERLTSVPAGPVRATM
jgi:replicative DNA helicase